MSIDQHVVPVAGHDRLLAAARPGPDRAVVLPLHALVLITGLAAVIVRQGAYHTSGQRIGVVVLALAVALALWKEPRIWRDGTLAVLPVCVALAGWAVLSARLAGNTASAWSTVGLLAGVVAVIMVCRRVPPAQRDALAGAAVALGVLVAASGWIGVAWRHVPWALQDRALWRAATTLTYANAGAGLLVPLTVVALAQRTVRPRAALPALASCMLLVGLGATLSRGGAVALVVGLVVLAWLLGWAAVAQALAAPALGALVALAGLAPSMPASAAPRPALAVVALLAGLAVAAGLPLLGLRLGRRGAVAALLGALLVVALLVPSALAVGVPQTVAHFRLSFTSSDRVQAAKAALRVAAARPLTGAGPDRALLFWKAANARTLVIQYAHNEYLQELAELGAVGLALLLLLLALAARMVWHGQQVAGSRATWAGVVAALVALALHSGFDFLWHLPAIPLVGALLIGITALPVSEKGGRPRQAAHS